MKSQNEIKTPLIKNSKGKENYSTINSSPNYSTSILDINIEDPIFLNHITPWLVNFHDEQSTHEVMKLRSVSKKFKKSIDAINNIDYKAIENGSLAQKTGNIVQIAQDYQHYYQQIEPINSRITHINNCLPLITPNSICAVLTNTTAALTGCVTGTALIATNIGPLAVAPTGVAIGLGGGCVSGAIAAGLSFFAFKACAQASQDMRFEKIKLTADVAKYPKPVVMMKK